MGVPDHLTCILRNLYAEQEAIELGMKQRTGSKLKQYTKPAYCYPAHLTYMQSTVGLDASEAVIKIFRRNINILIYADDTTLMAEI